MQACLTDLWAGKFGEKDPILASTISKMAFENTLVMNSGELAEIAITKKWAHHDGFEIIDEKIRTAVKTAANKSEDF